MDYTIYLFFGIFLSCFMNLYNAVEFQSLRHDQIHQLHRHKRSARVTDEQMQNISPSNRPNCKPGATKPNIQVNTTERLRDLRQLFNGAGIEAYLIPSEDAHQSEYTSEYDARRQYITGFDGSYGKAVVFRDRAALWTDGRYFLQAEDQLDCNWILMKQDEVGVPSVEEYVIFVLKSLSNKRYGANSFLVGSSAWDKSSKELQEGGITMVSVDNELIDRIWTTGNGRPAQPSSVINALPIQFAGRSWQDKIQDMHTAMAAANVDFMIITGLDETAWLFNLRATDVPFNPFFISYATIARTTNKTVLYLVDHATKLTQNASDPMTKVKLAEHLNTGNTGSCAGRTGLCVEVKQYSNTQLLNDVASAVAVSNKVWVSFLCNYAIYSRIPKNKLHQANTPVALQKSQKNAVERQGMKNAHIRDAVALITFVAKLEKEVKEGKRWTEVSAAADLKNHRMKQDYNRGLSFPSISSSGSNGAVIHYFPTPATDKQITTKEMYLLDSGGQYLDGTTDVTRTFHFGTPTDYEKECYTRVLMGHVDLARYKFVTGNLGREIDAIARRPLWEAGLQYRHGTGHGIGAYLSVHEGPGRISLSHASFVQDSPLDEYQFFSDEPGYYEDGKFGIRLENIFYIKRATDLKYAFPDTTFLEFETITLVPYEPHLIKFDMLSEAQISWLNTYYQKISNIIVPLVENDPVAKEWLQSRLGVVTETGIGAGNLNVSSVLLLTLCVIFKIMFQ